MVTSSDTPFEVYVVEDDEAVLKSLGALMEAHGYGATLCRTAEDFLKSLLLSPNTSSASASLGYAGVCC